VGIKLSTEFLDKWKHIINDVEKSDIPTHLIDKLVVRLNGADGDTGSEEMSIQTINISELKDQGYLAEEIESVINETLYELNDYIDRVDFFLDIDAVAREVQPETDKILNNLNG
jgi:hypothetical protein